MSDLFRVIFSPVSLEIAVAAVLTAALMLWPPLPYSPGNTGKGFTWTKYAPLWLKRHLNRDKTLSKAVSCDVATGFNSADGYEIDVQKQSTAWKAIEGTICAVSMVVESRDPYTAGHQRRVAGLARAIAGEMGLSEWQVTGVYIAGLLHDVGKMAVPFEILSKPGKLTQNELSIIKSHCRVGYEILQKIEFPWPVTTAILQHHERLDGSGYPNGIGGGEIIIEARILGVADVVEAMSSHRPYRPALGLDSAMAEISGGKGVLYDNKVADACLRLLNHNEAEFDRIMATAARDDYSLELARA
jgi:putative nucleotidyltransferase with HDIG domain